MNSSEKLRPLSPRPLAKCNVAAAFCDTHVHGAGVLRDSEEAHQIEKAYTIASQRGPEMPKAPKNAPPDPHASESSRLAVAPDDVRAAAAAISSSVIVTECDLSRTLSEICG